MILVTLIFLFVFILQAKIPTDRNYPELQRWDI